MSVARLSALRPAIVDSLFGTATATPKDEPKFIWLVGAPGVGKSTGHRVAIVESLLTPNDYATINVDTLLESLLPFRVGSALGHLVTHAFPDEATIKFSSIGAYQTKKENVGAFGWYNTVHPTIEEKDPVLVAELNGLRVPFFPLKDKEKSRSLLDKTEAAIHRAIAKRVDIVYETTLSVNSAGRVAKFDDIMEELKGTPYSVYVIHLTAPTENISRRLESRQEFSMPYEERPLYRTVPEKMTTGFVAATAAGVAALREQYAGSGVVFHEIENPADAGRATAHHAFNVGEQLERISSAYATGIAELRMESPTTSSEVKKVKGKKKSVTKKAMTKPKSNTTTRRKTNAATGGKKSSSESSR